ncbi:hypothetical protein Dsin_010717 [Dipteronia sinensis]|uniref:Uncharacterized protein n=1 Tax=Dipteronia sinensis TaxID=43782 RepID=A0AAE0AU85_9ROSI|nr:hypothetical protein Dsin_010717 [Dipteronia sinensis]
MKIKNKGKVYPSPSPSPSPSSSSFSSSSSVCSNAAGGGGGGGGGGGEGGGLDYLSVLKLLPAAIIALASVLPLEDREVLAYLIMRSMKTTVSSSFSAAAVATNPPSFPQKKPSKKSTPNNSGSSGSQHKAPGLYCDCFDCYTSFWVRWDSSSNRELIHQAIEAFEDHLTSGESERSKKNGKGKRRDKTARRFAADNNNKQLVNVVPGPGPGRPESSVIEKQVEMTEESSGSTVFVAAAEVSPVSSPERESGSAENNEASDITIGSSPAKEELTEVVRSSTATGCSTHKGLARKVLPDVLGLFNSRLWSLWSPNV